MSDSQSIFETNDIFKTMHPIKLKIMKELVQNMQGKQMKEAAPLLVAATNQLKKHNLSFTPDEVAALLGVLTKDMTPEEKAKVEMMKEIVRKKH